MLDTIYVFVKIHFVQLIVGVQEFSPNDPALKMLLDGLRQIFFISQLIFDQLSLE